MASPKQVKLLKKGVEAWNDWRKNNPDKIIDLTEANLRGADLTEANFTEADLFNADLSGAHLSGAYLDEADLNGADLSGAHLNGADLSKADLSKADLSKADLSGATLRGADLSGAHLNGAHLSLANLNGANLFNADLSKADLRGAYLSEANLIGASLFNADLRGTNLNLAHLNGANLREAGLKGASLNGADLSEADLSEANLSEASLSRANLSRAKIGYTILGDIDFSETLGLAHVRHIRSSILSTNTMVHSKGKISEVFLRGCGLSDWEIEAARLYDPNLTNQDMDEILYKVHEIRASQPIQISPLFISYSHADGEFVDKLENHLNDKGVRFWRDVHDATSGKLEKQIDRAIRHNPIVLIILSANSVKSDWVEHEVRLARELEKETLRDVLCPVALDDSWKTSRWPKRAIEQVMEYNILDFSNWNDNSKFKNTFVKLIDGLNLYYKKQF